MVDTHIDICLFCFDDFPAALGNCYLMSETMAQECLFPVAIVSATGKLHGRSHFQLLWV